ncbi:6-phosphofructo-2-kinase/fructose-2,6-bisphosphatase 2-like [Babylonia areolata]|uniref:6-phosphofructo-2-kinase/fructose-2, 6-bisphosphatase 2-like n=1 Tax=Babylonia areolata TaxID=304850 RepID=UPI003FD627A2
MTSNGGSWVAPGTVNRCGYRPLFYRSQGTAKEKATCPGLLCTPTAIGMVGLPARGKSYISKKLTRYLNWMGIRTAIFNVGNYRRRLVATDEADQNFFRSDNEAAQEIREKCALMAVEEASKFLRTGGEVAIIDATNTTRKRRQMLMQEFTVNNPFHLFFVESVCDDDSIIRANILEVKVGGPDYVGQDPDMVVRDFFQRIANYRQVYEPVGGEGEEAVPYIQVINQGARFVVNRPIGLLQSRVASYLMKVRVLQRTIFLTKHGESSGDVEGRAGGDGDLTERGWKFAEAVTRYLQKEGVGEGLKVWSGEKRRCVQTATYIRVPDRVWPALNDRHLGVCEGLTTQEMEATYPEHFAIQQQDTLRFRYPGGESYQDLIARLEPVIMELEQTTDVLIVSHVTVLRCLLAYFLDKRTG